MSYRRYDNILTQSLLEYCTYVVREEEADKYKAAGVKSILVIPKDARLKCGTKIWSFMTTLYWIIENTPESVIAVVDDDIEYFSYLLTESVNITAEYKNSVEVATSEIERIAQLIVDLQLGFAATVPSAIPYKYDKEFHLKGTPGTLRWINKPCLKAVFDPKDFATSDIDMAMQEVMKNRIILMPMYFTEKSSSMGKNKGGTTVQSNIMTQYRLALKNKWGKYYQWNERKNQSYISIKR